MSKKVQMFALVEQWRKSSLTRKSFANANGIKSQSFEYWCKKQYNEVEKPQSLNKTTFKPPLISPGFVELTTNSDSSIQKQSVRIELDLPGGIHIKIY